MLAYGVAPSDEVPMEINVEPVMSYCGPVVNLRRVPKNTCQLWWYLRYGKGNKYRCNSNGIC